MVLLLHRLKILIHESESSMLAAIYINYARLENIDA